VKVVRYGREVRAGSLSPRGYGVSYHLMDRDAVVMHPIPLNLIIGFCNRVYWKLRAGFRPHEIVHLTKEQQRVSIRLCDLTAQVTRFSDVLEAFVDLLGARSDIQSGDPTEKRREKEGE